MQIMSHNRMKKFLESCSESKFEQDRIEFEMDYGWTFKVVVEKIDNEVVDLEADWF